MLNDEDDYMAFNVLTSNLGEHKKPVWISQRIESSVIIFMLRFLTHKPPHVVN